MVSALTFHEVRDVEDKTVSVGEAVRVLQPGGRFAFVDLFDDARIYGGRARAEEAVRQAGGVLETSRRVSDLVDLRWPLTLRQALKYGVILTGTKSAGTYPGTARVDGHGGCGGAAEESQPRGEASHDDL